MSNLVFESNMPDDLVVPIRKALEQSSGTSRLALSMLDAVNRGMTSSLKVDSSVAVEMTSESLIGNWLKCQSSRVYLRSVKQDGVFLDTYAGVKLVSDDSFPESPNCYINGTSVILDVIMDGFIHTYKCYRWPDRVPRTLTLSITDD